MELRNKMHYAIKFSYCLGKTAVELMKEAYEDKCFCESNIFKCHDFKKKDIFLQNWLLSLSDQKVLWIIKMLTMHGQSWKKIAKWDVKR